MSALTSHTQTHPPHKLATGNTTVDKMRIVLREQYQTQEEKQRHLLLQGAVDQYLYHLFRNGKTCYNEASEQPRLREEVQNK